MIRLPELPSSQQPRTHTFPCLLSRNVPRLKTSAFVSGFLCQQHLVLIQGQGHLRATATPLVPVVQVGTALKKQNCPCTYSTTATKLTAGMTSGQSQFIWSSIWDVCVWVPLLMLCMLHSFLLLRLRNTRRYLSSPKPCPRHTSDYKRSACTSPE